MKVLFIDGDILSGMDQVHDLFASSFGFPAYYGKNLDALYDCLSEISYPFGVIVVNVKSLKKVLGRRAHALLALLNDLADERENFYLIIDPFNESTENKPD